MLMRTEQKRENEEVQKTVDDDRRMVIQVNSSLIESVQNRNSPNWKNRFLDNVDFLRLVNFMSA